MPEDPIGQLFAQAANTLNMMAPHVVIPKMMAALVPQPGQTTPGGAATSGAGYGGIRERRAEKEDAVAAMQQKWAQDRAASQKAGFSVTGKTIIF